jgi:hypothetical protein
MRRSFAGVALATVVLVSACGEQTDHTSLGLRSSAPLAADVAACPDGAGIDAQITALFSGGNQTAALSKFANIAAKLDSTPPGEDTATAQQHTLDLIGFTLQKYAAGTLNGGTSSTTQSQVVALVNGLLCFSGLPQSFSLGDLGPDGAFAVITTSTPDTTVTTGNLHAGVNVDSGSVTQTVLLTIRRLPDSPGPLLTQLDQYPVFYEFDVTPKVPFTLPVLVGVCQASSVSPPDPTRLRIAHNIAPDTMGSIEILPFAPAPFLDCSNVALRSSNPLANFAMAGWRAVTSFFGPEPLLASTGGIGGTVKTFSPFGAVDTLAVMTPNSPTNQSWPVGGTVPAAPSVVVKTPQGRAISGLPVSFGVTAGGGSLTGAAATTDLTGVATIGSWTLGPTPGLNTVTATATPPQVGSGVAGNPQTFNATALPPSKVAFLTQPSSIVAGATMSPAVRVAVEDQNGDVVTSSSAPVSLTLSPSGPTLGGTTTGNAVNGIATFSNLTVTKAGTGYTLVATSGTLSQATSAPFSVTSAAAATIAAVAGDNQTATEGSSVLVPPAVRIWDQYGNPVAGVSVSFAIQNGGGSLTGALQVTDASGTATVGSWTLVAGTNYLLATAGLPNIAGNPVTFTATGASSTTTLVNCPPSVGARDDLSRAFYHPKYPGRSLKQVELYLSSNASTNSATPYIIQLIAKAGGFNGAVIGTSTDTVYLRGSASQNLLTNFVFAGTPAVQRNSTVTFQFNVLSNPNGAALTFNVGSCGLGDTHCKSGCSIVETNDASGTLSTFRRQGCGVTILGGS